MFEGKRRSEYASKQVLFLKEDEDSNGNGPAACVRAVFQEVVHVQAVAHRREAQQKEESRDEHDDRQQDRVEGVGDNLREEEESHTVQERRIWTLKK